MWASTLQSNATFDEAMNSSTLNPTTFTVTGPGVTVVDGKVSYDVPDQIVTFTPLAPLAPSTTFTATITTAAQDLSGNALATNDSGPSPLAPPLPARRM